MYCRWPEEFHCLHIKGLYDNQKLSNSIDQYFGRTLPFIDDALASGGKILVNCWAGVSRSSSTIAAYLIQNKHVTRDEALEQIRVNRPQARPNRLYKTQLDELYNTLTKNRTKSESLTTDAPTEEPTEDPTEETMADSKNKAV